MSGQYGWGNDALRGEDSILRLGLSGRPQNTLIRSEIYTVSQVLDLLALEPSDRPDIRNLGAKGWAEIEEAVERPMLPLNQVVRP